MRLIILAFLILLPWLASAKSSRTVRLADGDMEQIFVEPGYSTLLKFTSHPEPGLIGDQDGFKVEYMKNIVAIKPLLPRGKTNLFVFTKEGQFNFQLVTGHGMHDNVVMVEPKLDKKPLASPSASAVEKIPIEALSTKKMGKVATGHGFKLTLDSILEPKTHSSIVLRLTVEKMLSTKASNCKNPAAQIELSWFGVVQNKVAVPTENMVLERSIEHPCIKKATGFILVRREHLAAGSQVKLTLTPHSLDGKSLTPLEISFNPDFRR